MALGGIDLSLLVVLQALLEESSVTRAGVRLGMPQPAVSNALARLRRHYKDELLQRAGNGYTLTPFARSLLPLVQESVRLSGRVFTLGQAGRPPLGSRTFAIGLSDYSMIVLCEPLLSRVRALAPNTSIDFRLATRDNLHADRGLLGYDLLVGPSRAEADSLLEVIVRDRIVYVADPDNPRLQSGRLTLGDLAALPHAAVRPTEPGSDPVTVALLQHGIGPDVVLTVPDWLALPFLVAGTDLVAAVPERLARRVSGTAGVMVVEPPFGPVELVEAAWWHPTIATDPALAWLRGVVAEVAASLVPVPHMPGQRQGNGAA